MPFDVKETELPGVGKKYELYLDEERSVSVLIKTDGEREIYYRERREDDYDQQFVLTDSQARTLGLFLVGAYYQPIAAQVSEETASGEHIRWYSLTHDSGLVGNREDEVVIEEQTDTTVLGLERDGEVRSVIEDDVVFEAGDRLIVVGTADAHTDLERLLETF